MGTTRLACLLLVSTSLAVSGCPENEPQGCVVKASPTIASSPLTLMPNVRLERAGLDARDGFVFIGLDEAGATIRAARVSEDGQLGHESTLTIPTHVLGPWMGLTGKAAPGDQLAIVYGATKEGVTPAQIELLVISLDLQTGAAAAPKPLQDAQGKDLLLPPLPDIATAFRASMGTSETGRVSAFAWGYANQGGLAPKFVIVKPDGAVAAPPMDSVSSTAKKWDCLAVVPSRGGTIAGRGTFALSVVALPETTPGVPSWIFDEIRDDGGKTYRLPLMVQTKVMSCPTVAPTSHGFAISWQTPDGTFYSNVDVVTNSGDITPTERKVVGAVRFGGAEQQPKVACLAAMNKEFGIAYDARTGPQVDRFTVFGEPKGASLFLPVQGRPGPASAWSTQDAFFITYLDQDPTGGAKTARKLVKVQCLSPL
jgi:hypothetical protein